MNIKSDHTFVPFEERLLPYYAPPFEPQPDYRVVEIEDFINRSDITFAALEDKFPNYKDLMDRMFERYQLYIDEDLKVRVNKDYEEYKNRKCKSMTKEMYPDKMDYKEFVDYVRGSLQAFEDNMEHLKMKNRYVEEWMELFAKWMEMK